MVSDAAVLRSKTPSADVCGVTPEPGVGLTPAQHNTDTWSATALMPKNKYSVTGVIDHERPTLPLAVPMDGGSTVEALRLCYTCPSSLTRRVTEAH